MKKIFAVLVAILFLAIMACSSGSGDDASSSSWTHISMNNAPNPGYYYSWVWTGTEFIIWGGYINNQYLNTGSKYNPSKDEWAPISTIGAPSPRYMSSAIWTGSEMIVWGGHGSGGKLSDGGRYDPVTDTWKTINTQNAPEPRENPTLIWTGKEMIVLAGLWALAGYEVYPPEDCKIYDPQLNIWRSMSLPVGLSLQGNGVIFWTGNELLAYRTIYNPAIDTWRSMNWQGAPSEIFGTTNTGNEMIAYGYTIINGRTVNAGATYDYASDQWHIISDINAPRLRKAPIVIWTGTEMWILGGRFPFERYNPNNPPAPYTDGGRYNMGADKWKTTPTLPYILTSEGEYSPVLYAWTGTEIIIITLSKGKGIRLKVDNP